MSMRHGAFLAFFFVESPGIVIVKSYDLGWQAGRGGGRDLQPAAKHQTIQPCESGKLHQGHAPVCAYWPLGL